MAIKNIDPEVALRWRALNEPLEGWCTWMYLDVRGLVTTGMGCLIDATGISDPAWRPALQLPWHLPDGSPASETEVRAQWAGLRARTFLRGYTAAAQAAYTTARTTDADVQDLVDGRLNWNAVRLQVHFPDLATWPLPARLATHSMAWAMGPDFSPGWPMFTRAALAHDWLACASQCVISTAGNPGVAARNAADIELFREAARS